MLSDAGQILICTCVMHSFVFAIVFSVILNIINIILSIINIIIINIKILIVRLIHWTPALTTGSPSPPQIGQLRS